MRVWCGCVECVHLSGCFRFLPVCMCASVRLCLFCCCARAWKRRGKSNIHTHYNKTHTPLRFRCFQSAAVDGYYTLLLLLLLLDARKSAWLDLTRLETFRVLVLYVCLFSWCKALRRPIRLVCRRRRCWQRRRHSSCSSTERLERFRSYCHSIVECCRSRIAVSLHASRFFSARFLWFIVLHIVKDTWERIWARKSNNFWIKK